LLLTGCMLLLTALLLLLAYFLKPFKTKESLSFTDALLMGIAQACAVMPGLSRSGATIATGVMLGADRAKVARFSFLMVIIPVLGEALLDGMKSMTFEGSIGIASLPSGALILGFVVAFVSGYAACRWMLNIVRQGKLIYFTYYCIAIGLFSIIYSILNS